ncbi:MAG: RNA polymerase-binding protein DksA [Desulfobulbaceae bacterium]|jgi:DnaK suppressor protein|nr:RNA polymerase-binding protein DksA [Desulfobulbaceae bacterium]
MEKAILEQFRVQLLAKQAEIEQAMEKTLEGMTDQSANIPDPNDRATIESDRGFELRIRDREKKLLKKIKEALIRIDDGGYGICVNCGEDIGVKRLEARPVTNLCIDCKTSQENKEKSMGQ